MNKYRITNTESGEVVVKEAEYLQHAIEVTGWPPEVCSCEIVSQPKGKKIKAFQAPVRKKATAKRKESSKNAVVEPVVTVAGVEQSTGEPTEKIQAVVAGPTEAETEALEHKKLIEALAIEAEVMFLRMGQLLYGARENAEWNILHYESYREYVEDLKLPVQASYSWATRLSAIYEYLVKSMKIDEKILAEIGVAKLTRLLPLARKGELTEEVIEAARVLSDLDLREELGQNIGGSDGEKVDNVVCPRCGEVFNQRKATRA